ncbi:MAG: hypothetical protein C0501_11545 [Isosphaera sp.]|nr:hypothetical protein [Isosphaera sp.]
MASGTTAARAEVGGSFVEKFGAQAPKVMIGAAVLGLVAVFLPAVTVSIAALNVSESVSAVQAWQGKLGLVAYVGVGVLAGLMLKGPAARPKVLACVIAAGVALVLAVWLLVSAGNVAGSMMGAAVKTGFGVYVNVLAAAALAAGAALLAKREKLF